MEGARPLREGLRYFLSKKKDLASSVSELYVLPWQVLESEDKQVELGEDEPLPEKYNCDRIHRPETDLVQISSDSQAGGELGSELLSCLDGRVIHRHFSADSIFTSFFPGVVF